MEGTAVNTYVFVFSFACAFLLAGKRPVLALSTRLMLVLVVVLGGAYALLHDSPYQSIVGAATLTANVLFVLFGGIDFLKYRDERQL